MARVLILTLVFPPDGVSTAHMVGDLAVDLHVSGHDVTVITTTPHYNRDEVARATQPLANHWGRLLQRSAFHGLPVYHVYMPPKGGRVVARLAAWALFHVMSTIAAATVVRGTDVIIAPSPPLTIGLNAWAIGLFKRAPFVYNVQEIYPDLAIALGALQNRTLIALLLRLERFVYDRAAQITVITSGMGRRLAEKGVPPAKLQVVPNAVDLEMMTPLPKDNAFASSHGLQDRFVVCYAGNMGPAQQLDTVLDAAALLKDLPDLTVLLVGGGILFEHLSERARALDLANVRILPHQPYAIVPQIYAASDVCLVPLAEGAGTDASPSKAYRVMGCGRPIVAATDDSSDLAALVREAGCGERVPPGDASALARVLRHAHDHRAEWCRRGAAGRRHAEQHYSRQANQARYDAIVRSLA